MSIMIQQSKLVEYVCPQCGFITKGIVGKTINCPKCTDEIVAYTIDKLRLQNEEGCFAEQY